MGEMVYNNILGLKYEVTEIRLIRASTKKKAPECDNNIIRVKNNLFQTSFIFIS